MTPEQDAKLIEILKRCAFALESAAHLRGLERELLPVAEQARDLIKQLESQ